MTKAASETVLMDAERRNISGPISPAVIIQAARVTGGASPTITAYAHNTNIEISVLTGLRLRSFDRSFIDFHEATLTGTLSNTHAIKLMCDPEITST